MFTSSSPYKEVFTRSDLDMMTVNADGSVSSSTGHLEDPSAANPRSYWQAQWAPQEPEEEETPPVDENGNPIATDPNTGEPVTGGETPGTGEPVSPEPGGTTDPGTGQVIGQVGGGSADGGESGAGGQTAPETPEPSGGETAPTEEPAGGEPQAPDEGFIIVN